MRRLTLSFLSGAALVAALTLSACATVAQPAPTPRESTAFTLATDQPLTSEQQAMQFDKAAIEVPSSVSGTVVDHPSTGLPHLLLNTPTTTPAPSTLTKDIP